jgi:hypothetical protein
MKTISVFAMWSCLSAERFRGRAVSQWLRAGLEYRLFGDRVYLSLFGGPIWEQCYRFGVSPNGIIRTFLTAH